MKNIHILRVEDFDFSHAKLIARGGFAEVKKVKRKMNDTFYAVKFFFDSMESFSMNKERTLPLEAEILSQLDYPTIVKFYGIIEMDNKIGIVSEFIPNGSFKDYIEHDVDRPEWNITNKYISILGISLSMRYLHSKNIIHRNIKPMNVVFDSNFYPKISSLSLARKYSPNVEPDENVGTLFYSAPEIMQCQEKYDGKKADVFSFGMTMYSIIYDYPPTRSNSIEFNNEIGSEFINKLIRNCIHEDTKKRPNFDEITTLLLNGRDQFPQSENIDENRVNTFLEYCNIAP